MWFLPKPRTALLAKQQTELGKKLNGLARHQIKAEELEHYNEIIRRFELARNSLVTPEGARCVLGE
ncbi:hypothetical protein K470DRAFT_256322 [Piedraia hortae CBS 480.64]|uniref:Uncharacterized protein n=1 Tax=Piedraia hortae CBS 480.64 TaxID=1314780 RepID=A0A6A7C3J6_9PEZI|nr:hypothetical protein K470DRAFT_256322 [Piedraia hortae CBS 480.64]